jgi:histidinol-phosphate aminotransferase
MRPVVSEGINQLRPYVPGKPVEEVARELGINNATKLASNENPLGPSPKALAAAALALPNIHRYPDAAAFSLRARLATGLGVHANELIFGNGSNELLDVVIRTFCQPGDNVVFADPSFVVYEMSSLASNLAYTAVPLQDFRHPLRAMAAACDERTRVVFIANPNNPTGTYVTRAEVVDFLSLIPAEVFVVLDEAYFEFATANDYPDGLKLRALHERLVVLRTFSKAYGLAGLRVGYGVLGAEYADYMNRVRAPFNVNSLAQAAAIAALDDEEHLRKGVELNRAERERVTDVLTSAGLKVVPSQANFVYISIPGQAKALADRVLKHGVITRTTSPDGLRVSIGLPEENDRFLAVLREVL